MCRRRTLTPLVFPMACYFTFIIFNIDTRQMMSRDAQRRMKRRSSPCSARCRHPIGREPYGGVCELRTGLPTYTVRAKHACSKVDIECHVKPPPPSNSHITYPCLKSTTQTVARAGVPLCICDVLITVANPSASHDSLPSFGRHDCGNHDQPFSINFL